MIYSLDHLLDAYRDGLSAQQVLTVRQAMGTERLPSAAVMLRFDMERDPAHHLALATQLAGFGRRCTFYAHTRGNCYDPPVLRAMQEMGHEIGYHHECLDRCNGDSSAAADLFRRELDQFRGDGIEVLTVCSHGEAGLPKNGFRSNWELFERRPELLAESGILGEMYLWKESQKFLYASDTFSKFRTFWQTINDAEKTDEPLMILAHLHRWRRNPLRSVAEVSRDLAQNAANRVFRKRRYELGY